MTDAAPAVPVAADHVITSRQRALILTGTLLGMLVAAINQTSVTTVLPTIATDLHGLDLYTWVFTISMLGSAVSVPMFGKLSDLYGRRLLFIIGMVTFMVGALAAGFAQSMEQLIAARGIQGIGMGAIMPLAMAIIADVVPANERGKWQGIMGAVFGLATVLGPVAGGWVTDQYGWRWIFWANLPLGLIALATIVTQLHLPFTPRRAKIDVLGAVTFGGGLSALLLALSEGGTSHPWGSTWIVGLLVAAGVLLVSFVLVERRAVEPLIPLDMLADRNVALTSIAGLSIGAGMFVGIFYVPLFMQAVVGTSSASSGMALVPLMFGLIVSSTVSGIMITRTQRYKAIIVVGPLIAMVGLYLMSQMSPDVSVAGAGWRMFIVGLGIGMAMQNLLLVAQNSVPLDRTGVVTSLATLVRSVGGTVGIAVLGTIFATQLPGFIGDRFDEAGLPADAASGGGELTSSTILQAGSSDLPDAVKEALRLGVADTLEHLFLISIPVLAIAFLAALALRRDPLSDRASVRVVDELEHELADLVPIDAEHAIERDEHGDPVTTLE
jgi:EmrB/QacA subfamily drug resistance transporter